MDLLYSKQTFERWCVILSVFQVWRLRTLGFNIPVAELMSISPGRLTTIYNIGVFLNRTHFIMLVRQHCHRDNCLLRGTLSIKGSESGSECGSECGSGGGDSISFPSGFSTLPTLKRRKKQLSHSRACSAKLLYSSRPDKEKMIRGRTIHSQWIYSWKC